MKYGILSDIHGNLEALEAVLETVGEVDSYLCLGDIVGYGANPNECCDLIRELAEVTILGNHDEVALGRMDLEWFNPYARAAAEWTMAQLTPATRDFLSQLKPTARVGDLTLAHGSLPDPWEYVTNSFEALNTFECLKTDLCFIGHTHYAEYYWHPRENLRVRMENLIFGGVVELDPGCRYLLNPGSVGQPRDQNWKASAALYDTDAPRVEVLRVPYDLATAQAKIRAAGLPDVLWQRLAIGR
jgi:diadenosine tetraphosphatase ApaH/serine/threonine PP2A family protein phosphatase